MRIIIAARSTEGVFPAMAQNSAAHSMVNTAVVRFPLPSRRVSRLARKARCIPDTATVWDRPVRSREEVNWSVRLSRLPVTRARTSPASRAGKAPSMLSFNPLDSTAGQSRTGTRSDRSTFSSP